LVANNLLLAAGLGVVFVGSGYPLLVDVLGAGPISVGPPYFNATFGPLMVPLVVLMAVGPYLGWGAARTDRLARKLALPALLALALPLYVYALHDVRAVFALIGFALSAWLAAATIGILWGRLPWRTPRATWGMALAHLGVAITLFGITASGALTRELLVNLRVGETARVGGFAMQLDSVMPVAGANWTALEATLAVTRGSKPVTVLRPQARLYTSPVMDTTEAAIHTRVDGDLYAVLGKPDGSGRWQLHVWWKPFVVWIWAGGLIMALGGGLSMTARASARRSETMPADAVVTA
jgi:cytochrome c-type biogenesis protein CcmF